MLHNGLGFPCANSNRSKGVLDEWEISVKRGQAQNVRLISLEGLRFFAFGSIMRHRVLESLFKGQGVMCKIPPPALAVSSQR